MQLVAHYSVSDSVCLSAQGVLQPPPLSPVPSLGPSNFGFQPPPPQTSVATAATGVMHQGGKEEAEQHILLWSNDLSLTRLVASSDRP